MFGRVACRTGHRECADDERSGANDHADAGRGGDEFAGVEGGPVRRGDPGRDRTRLPRYQPGGGRRGAHGGGVGGALGAEGLR
ncbi:hypothetical protein JYQ29_12875, partial [Curtobacterium flaccumfaciens pv. flaccumfaciens]|nr:hypothetical protein [Curtobacterium flaccumfaciens pv. flaccumfaciens]